MLVAPPCIEARPPIGSAARLAVPAAVDMVAAGEGKERWSFGDEDGSTTLTVALAHLRVTGGEMAEMVVATGDGQ